MEEHSNTQRTPYLFTAKELDEETGLYYFGARYYDPRTSVWQSPDPVLAAYLTDPGRGINQPLNLALYSYSYQNPVNLKDPDGNTPVCLAGWPGVIACAGAALWGLFEVGSTALDFYDVVTTLSDPNASNRDIALSLGGALLGIVGPGGGYSQADEGLDILQGLRRTFNDKGFRREFFDEAGKPTRYRDPMTNELVEISDDMNIHLDHIYPKRDIERLEGFEDLTRAQQKELLEDPVNFQPLPGSMNCSKGGRCVTGERGPWERYKQEDLDPGYRDWLEGEQRNLGDYFQQRIDNMLE